MSDFSRKKNLANRVPIAQLGTSAKGKNPLSFYTSHPKRPGLVELNEFVSGLSIEDIESGKAHHSQRKPFTGRPELTNELAPEIYRQYHRSSEQTVAGLHQALRWWWRFLDDFEQTVPESYRFVSSAQWDGIHYAFYRVGHIKGYRFCSEGLARKFFNLLAGVRKNYKLPFWWQAIPTKSKQRELLTSDEVRRLYQFFVREARNGKARIEQATSNAKFVPEGEESAIESIILKDSDPAPTKNEIVSLFVLFLIQSGWNEQVALDVDVEDKDKDGNLLCILPSLNKPATHSRVLSTKERAKGTVQQTESLDRFSLSPANIIRFLVPYTEPLRAELRDQIRVLEEKKRLLEVAQHVDELPRVAVEITRLKMNACSPWLYKIRSRDFEILPLSLMRFSVAYNQKLVMPLHWAVDSINEDIKIRRARAIAEGLEPSASDMPLRRDMVMSDFRDSFIVWRYENSGYSWLEGLLASGSSDLNALRSYFNKKRLIKHARTELVRGAEAIWKSIKITPIGEVSSKYLPVAIAARVAGIGDDQIQRWLDGKDRTAAGTGCRNIMNPPRRIDPMHQQGKPCVPHRCFICQENAILITDERGANDLARVRAELLSTKENVALISWFESDWPNELEIIENVWAQFDQIFINQRFEWWTLEIRSGRHIPSQLEGYSE